MKKASFGIFLILAALAVVSLPATTFAQAPGPTRDRFVISARAGGVNAVTGRASVRMQGKTEWELLTIKEDLATGDTVQTGTDGRVEMLLNPGSYLRLGENSEFELANDSLDNLEIRLIRGTAIVEATGADDSQMQINISTPHTKIAIVRRGLYRLNVVPGDNTELIVRKGRVMLDKTKIGGGNKVVFSSAPFLVAKLQKADKQKVDNLDTWSKERAETVAQANKKIRQRELGVLMASMRDRWFGSMFSASTPGFWYFSSRYSCYTFVPFYMGWGSPYGSSYARAFFPGYYCGGCRGLIDYRNNFPSGSPTLAGSAGRSSTGSRPSVIGPVNNGASMNGVSRPSAMEGRVLRHQDRPN
ncbi:MAG TPA: FecR family protein [Pyrinomonadaceae bacterium]|nr:FecR family protein [Pyrinomonadaceae bacterium]